MATKLLRLVNDKKKSSNTGRDVETQDYVVELETKVNDLEMINKRLRENVNIINKFIIILIINYFFI